MGKRLFIVAFILITHMMLNGFAIAGAVSSFESRVHDGHLCARNSLWYSANNFTLHIVWEKAKMNSSYAIKHMKNGDTHFLIDKVFTTTDQQSAEAILFDGNVFITRNIKIQENYAIDVLDFANMFQQLPYTLIDLASPEGPQKTVFPLHRMITEAKYPITVTTPSAGGSYNAPWEATIDLVKKDNEDIEYNILFSFTTLQKDKTDMKLSGRLSNYDIENRNPHMPDDLNIAKWQQYNIGPYTKKMDKGTIVDFGTTYLERSFSTLGELRVYIREKNKNRKTEGITK